MNKNAALIEELERILAGGMPYDEELGLCNIVGIWSSPSVYVNKEILKKVILSWSKYTGNRRFPVPHPYLECCRAYQTLNNLWIGEYGKNRLELTALFLTALKAEEVKEYIS